MSTTTKMTKSTTTKMTKSTTTNKAESTTNKAEATPLGALARLPGELRNVIYELVMCTEDQIGDPVEVDYRKRCIIRHSLRLVSEQIHEETNDLVHHDHGQPCNHTTFGFRTSKRTFATDNMTVFDGCTHRHSLPRAKTIRFVAGDLTTEAPIVVTCHFQLPGRSTFDISGASPQRQEHLAGDLPMHLGIMQSKVLTMYRDARPKFKAEGLLGFMDRIHKLSVERLPQ